MSDAPRMVDLARSFDDGLIDDDGLRTICTIILFTDAKATVEDGLAAGEDPRGYWLDAYEEDPQEQTGSKLWLFKRRTLTEQTLLDVKQECERVLAALVDAGIASKVAVTVTRAQGDWADLTVQVSKPNDPNSPFEQTWELHFGLQ